ncbi:MAG: MBL fold metallo-hydrolase, partial [Bacilli bacterium]|nr:MBL fold metallo-hydrolase [Bacilli bacterium]
LVEFGNEKILLDCGNGITRLLKFPEILEHLHIFITHYHEDHFGDLGSIESTAFCYHNLGLLDDRINVYLPKNEYQGRKKMITSNPESYSFYHDIDENKTYDIGGVRVSLKDNHSHGIESYMIKLEVNDTKIVYTSDIGTTNLEGVIDFCKNADLLISESSLLRRHERNLKTHLTSYDAGRIASLSNASKLLLTHFWPEEDKKLYLEEAKEQFENVELAEEGKRLVLEIN